MQQNSIIGNQFIVKPIVILYNHFFHSVQSLVQTGTYMLSSGFTKVVITRGGNWWCRPFFP